MLRGSTEMWPNSRMAQPTRGIQNASCRATMRTEVSGWSAATIAIASSRLWWLATIR